MEKKLDGPPLNTEMEKQKLLRTFKHHTKTSHTVTLVERKLPSGKAGCLCGETNQARFE